jgi:Holliday junction resolvase RusA-like endonuclease
MIEFTIPGDPVGKGRARSTRSGVHYTPEKTREYEEMVGYLAKQAMIGKKPLTGACYARVMVYCSVPASASKAEQQRMLSGKKFPCKKPDIDNIIKAIFDACNGIVYHDDSQIVHLYVEKWYGVDAQTNVRIDEKRTASILEGD